MVTAFCRQAEVSQPSFYAWRKKLRDEATFAEVKLPPSATLKIGRLAAVRRVRLAALVERVEEPSA